MERVTSVDGAGDLEEAACPVCASVERELAYVPAKPYAVVRCRHCRLYYLSPRRNEAAMLRFYQETHYFEGGSVGYGSYTEQKEALRATFRRLMINLRQRALTGGSLLEVGCGYGYLLEQAQEFFQRRVGTEYSALSSSKARLRADCVYTGGIDDVPRDEVFDSVIATHVIEHVYDPLRFLRKVLAHAAPGGSVVIGTPNMGSLWRRVMGRRWPSFKLPEHVIFFDRSTLGSLMHAAGLVDVGPLPYPHAFPLTLVTRKLGVTLPRSLARIKVWLPETTLALYGKVPA